MTVNNSHAAFFRPSVHRLDSDQPLQTGRRRDSSIADTLMLNGELVLLDIEKLMTRAERGRVNPLTH